MEIRLVALVVLVSACTQFSTDTSPPPSIDESMSGEHLIMAHEFLTCMDDSGASIANVSVEIWDLYHTVTDVAWVVVEGPEPAMEVVDGCLMNVNASLAERYADER